MSENRLRTALLLVASGVLPFLLYGFVLTLPLLCDSHFGVAGAAGETYSATGSYRVDNPIDPEVFRAFPQTVPWWTSPDARLLFLRPLVNLTARADLLIWGKNPFGFHLTQLLFHCSGCLFLFLVGRRVLRNDWAAFLAVMIFSNHLYNVLVVAWVAERASVLSVALSLAGLWTHIRFRDGDRRAWAAAAWVLFVLAFLARESGALCLVAYFLYDIFLWRRERPDRWPGLLRLGLRYAVLCLPLGAFVVYYKLAGYGVLGHYTILDEGVGAVGALAYILKNVLLYVLSMLFFVPVTNQINLELFSRPLFLVPFLVLTLLALLFLAPGFRGKLWQDRRVPFLATWLFVSLLPTIHLLTQNRYVYPALAPFGLLVSFYLFRLHETRTLGRRFTPVLFAAAALYLAVLPIAGVWAKKDSYRRHHGFQAQVVQDTLGQLGAVSAERPVNVYFFNMPNSILTFALQYAFDLQSEKGAVRTFPLAITPDPPLVEVLGEKTLRVTSRSNPLLRSEGERLFMSADMDREGMRRENLFFEATIDKVEADGVRSVRFDLASPLAHEDNRFFFMEKRRLHPVSIPPGFLGELPLESPR